MEKYKSIYKRNDGRYEARYKKGMTADGKAIYASVYGRTPEEADAKRNEITGSDLTTKNNNELNLLILGAGAHGHDVKEVADTLRIFNKISFLDDNITGDENPDVVGTCKDASDFLSEYSCAFVALGDNKKRKKFAEFLEGVGFRMPNLIDVSAKVSQGAELGHGIAIMPGATVSEATIGDYVLLEGNSFVGRGTVLRNFARLGVGAMVPNDYTVPEGTWLKNGEVFSWKKDKE